MKTYEVFLFHLDVPKELKGVTPTLRLGVHANTPSDALRIMVDKAGRETEEPYLASGAVLGLGVEDNVSAPLGITILLFEPKVRVGSLLKAGVK